MITITETSYQLQFYHLTSGYQQNVSFNVGLIFCRVIFGVKERHFSNRGGPDIFNFVIFNHQHFLTLQLRVTEATQNSFSQSLPEVGSNQAVDDKV